MAAPAALMAPTVNNIQPTLSRLSDADLRKKNRTDSKVAYSAKAGTLTGTVSTLAYLLCKTCSQSIKDPPLHPNTSPARKDVHAKYPLINRAVRHRSLMDQMTTGEGSHDFVEMDDGTVGFPGKKPVANRIDRSKV